METKHLPLSIPSTQLYQNSFYNKVLAKRGNLKREDQSTFASERNIYIFIVYYNFLILNSLKWFIITWNQMCPTDIEGLDITEAKVMDAIS